MYMLTVAKTAPIIGGLLARGAAQAENYHQTPQACLGNSGVLVSVCLQTACGAGYCRPPLLENSAAEKPIGLYFERIIDSVARRDDETPLPEVGPSLAFSGAGACAWHRGRHCCRTRKESGASQWRG